MTLVELDESPDTLVGFFDGSLSPVNPERRPVWVVLEARPERTSDGEGTGPTHPTPLQPFQFVSTGSPRTLHNQRVRGTSVVPET